MSKPHDVVNILPISRLRVLLQLRDMEPGTSFGGQWGFFGGAVESSETPEDAAFRELQEELSVKIHMLHLLAAVVPPQHPAMHHVFCFALDVPFADLTLGEGLDFSYVSLEDVERGSIYSDRMQAAFPVIKGPYVPAMVKRAVAWAHACGYRS